MNARAIIEAETPKKFFASLPSQDPKLAVGDEVISGTGITRDIIEATLEKLNQLDPKQYAETADYDVQAYLNGQEEPEFDPEDFLMEILFTVMNAYCPPFTYFGFYEADGSVGCWPYEDMNLEELADTKPEYLSVQDGVRQPDFSAGARFVVIRTPDGHRQCWETATRKQVWSW